MRHLATISLAALVMALTATACGRDDAVPTAPLAPATAEAAGAQELDPGGTNGAIYAASSFYRKWRDGTVQYGQTTDNTCRVRGRGGASSDFTYTYQDANGNDVDLTVKAGPSFERSSRRFARGPGSRDDITCCTASPLFRDDLGPPSVTVRQPGYETDPGGHFVWTDGRVNVGDVGSSIDGIHYSRRHRVSTRRDPGFPRPSCSMGFSIREGSGPWSLSTGCNLARAQFRYVRVTVAVRAYKGRTYGPWAGPFEIDCHP